MDYPGLTAEQQCQFDEESHFQAKRVWALIMVGMLKTEGPEFIRKDIDLLLRAEFAKAFVVGTDG